MKYKVLLIEDDRVDQMAFKRKVSQDRLGYDYTIAGSVSEARDVLQSNCYDVIITDYSLGDGTAFDIFNMIYDTPVIVVTGGGDEGVAVKAMKAGAYDYLIKDEDQRYLAMLPITVEKAIKRKEAEQRLSLLESAVVNANDAIVILKEDFQDTRLRRIIYVNDAFTRMTGYSLYDVENKSLKILEGPESDLATLEEIHRKLDRREPLRSEVNSYRKDGTQFWAECNTVPVYDYKGQFSHWVSIQRDITGRKKVEAELHEKEGRLEYLAHHDMLTELPNRLYFNKRLNEELARARRNNNQLAVMFLDLDSFKKINDTYGHATGDELLKEVAVRISNNLRISDIVARWGGDEFTILLPDVKCSKDVEHIAEKIISVIQDSFNLGDNILNVTTSLGASIYPDNGSDMETLLKNADIALYCAKYEGKNKYQLYSDELNVDEMERV